MAPLILALKKEAWADTRVLASSQHRHLQDQVLSHFGIHADIDLDIMRPHQSLTTLTARLLAEFDTALQAEQPDAVLVQGDTATAMTAALASFHQRIPVGHVEAGLRTGDIDRPFPEEAHRIIIGKLARWHFAPTASARRHLLQEGIPDPAIFVSGNTVIDALLMTSRNMKAKSDLNLAPDQRLVLVTAHRRENFGAPLRSICTALATLAHDNPEVRFLYPVHPNPNVRAVAQEMLGAISNIRLCAPLDYVGFVAAMKRAYLVISDSGGIQEEAPALGKPVLVLRDETERTEAVEQGVVRLVGANCERIIREAQRLLDDADAYRAVARGISPYGDGHSAPRIVAVLKQHFCG